MQQLKKKCTNLRLNKASRGAEIFQLRSLPVLPEQDNACVGMMS